MKELAFKTGRDKLAKGARGTGISTASSSSAAKRDASLREFDSMHRGQLHTIHENQGPKSRHGSTESLLEEKDDDWELVEKPDEAGPSSGQQEHGRKREAKKKRKMSGMEKFCRFTKFGDGRELGEP